MIHHVKGWAYTAVYRGGVTMESEKEWEKENEWVRQTSTKIPKLLVVFICCLIFPFFFLFIFNLLLHFFFCCIRWKYEFNAPFPYPFLQLIPKLPLWNGPLRCPGVSFSFSSKNYVMVPKLSVEVHTENKHRGYSPNTRVGTRICWFFLFSFIFLLPAHGVSILSRFLFFLDRGGEGT